MTSLETEQEACTSTSLETEQEVYMLTSLKTEQEAYTLTSLEKDRTSSKIWLGLDKAVCRWTPEGYLNSTAEVAGEDCWSLSAGEC